MALVETRRFGSARALLAHLDPVAEHWGVARDWVFRGQEDASWGLVPSARRAERFRPAGERAPTGVRATLGEQIVAELEWALGFWRYADVQGLPVPELPSAWVRGGARAAADVPPTAWPHPDALPLLALAQHHGVPTCLLDWSRKPWVAAYFAAASAAREEGEGDLCVWALRRRCHGRSALDHVGVRARRSVMVVHAPRAAIPNLHAQSGLFTAVVEQDLAAAPFTGGLEGLIVSSAPSVDVPLLVRLLLPRREAPTLLALLAGCFVQGTTVFPGYAGAARSIHERARRLPFA